MIRDLEYVATGTSGDATWDIRHHVDERDYAGPLDEHARLNVNGEHRSLLAILLDDLAIGVMESVEDFIDEDDDPRELGVEREYYLGLDAPHEPRNGLLHSVAELELVAGIMPEDLRGEDWNLNNRLDPNENDGERAHPWDEPDDILDGGWAAMLTVHSAGGGATASGEPRLDLRYVASEDLQLRCGLDPLQAEALIAFARDDDNDLTILLSTTLGAATGSASVPPLDDTQLRAIFDETATFAAHRPDVGRLNINTISSDLLFGILPENEDLVEEILYLRTNRPEGFTSTIEFRDIPGISTAMIATMASLFDTTSNVYTITSRGRSPGSGVEVEMIVIVDRSTLPVTILEYREP